MPSVTLPFPPSTLSAHAKGNDRWKKIEQTKEFRALAAKEARKLDWPDFGDHKAYTTEGDIALRIIFVPPTKQGDRVNFPARAKPLLDGIADALKVNDARFVPQYQFNAPEKPGRVTVEVLG